MKQLTTNMLNEIATKLGTRPLLIVAIDWYGTGNYFIYSDKKISGISDDESIITVSQITSTPSGKAGQAVDLNIILLDTNGDIKNILNTVNIYHKPCIVYQFFEGLSDSDKFVVFKGIIDSPVKWSENSREIVLQILSEIEDQEIGVSLEETDIIETYPNESTPPWPLAFGNVVHVPATRVIQYPIAKLEEPFCYVDQMLYAQLAALERAWYDQNIILTFWKLVHQGANFVELTPVEVIGQYIYYVKLENYYQNLIMQNKIKLANINALRHEEKDKKGADKALIDSKDDIKDELDEHSDLFKAIDYQKTIIENYIGLMQYEVDLKRAAAANMLGAVNGLMNIYQTYVAAMMEICRQRDCASTVIKVEDSDFFPQEQDLLLVINGLKWRGQFSGGHLYLHPHPLARYTNVPLAPRGDATDECGNIESLKGADLFWVADGSYNLNNMYLLVKNRNRNWRHIIQVVEQDENKCRFQLIPFGQYNYQGQYGAQVVRSVTQLPSYQGDRLGQLPPGWNDLMPSIDPFSVLPTWIMELLFPVLPNDDEIENLRRLLSLNNLWGSQGVIIGFPEPRDLFTIIGEDIIEIEEVAAVPLIHWFDWPIYLEEYPSEIGWKANAGAEVRQDGQDHDIYVANILPSTIKSVYAYKTEDGEKILTKVPQSFYCKNEAEQLKDIDDNVKLTITSVRLKVPLSQIQGEQWEDQIYVTLDSSVGPNTVDIIEHLVQTYTNKIIDSTSFNAVKAKIDNYPSSFALFDRPNVYNIINDIAMQARCVAYINNDIIYLKYLAEEPTVDITLTETDISGDQSLDLSYGDASQLVTKLVATWQPNYLPDKEKTITLRHNINQYGLHENNTNFFIYNIEELVIKSATFWIIRWANLWKRVSFSTFLPQLKVDIYDTVYLNFMYDHLATGGIKAVIENLVYSPDENTISFDCWLPVKIGEMEQYKFAWPASAGETDEFPTEIEIDRGNAGGSGIGKGIVTIIEGCSNA